LMYPATAHIRFVGPGLIEEIVMASAVNEEIIH
jgi:hypothetical protein